MAAIFSGVSGQRAQMNLADKAIASDKYTNTFGNAAQKMPMDEAAQLVKGDYIVIPEVKDWDGRINVRTTEYTDRNGDKQTIETPFIICTVEHPGDGKEDEARADRQINFFPSIFDRLCFVVKDEAGIKVRTNNPIPMRGSAVDLYKSFKYEEAGVQKGMEALAGKKIHVADAEQKDVFRFGSQTETRKQSVYELNVVEKK